MFQTRDYLLKIFYFLCLVLAAIYCFKRPLFNWDMLPYTDLILRMDHHHAQEAHYLTYDLTKKNVPSKDFHQLTDSSNVYRFKMSSDPAAFDEQLPFYVIKPLYTGLAYLFYNLGVSLPQATLVPSFISYLLIGLLLFYWLRIYLSLPITFVISLLIMVSSPLIEVAKLSSPDCLSAFLLLASFYFIIEKPSLWPTIMFMVLSVFARLDNIVTCLLILSIISLSKKWYKEISVKNFLLIAILFAFCYFLIGLISYQYGWSIFFYNNFAERLHPIYESTEYFSFKSYFRVMYEHAMSGINHSYLAIFLALLFLSFNERFALKKLSFDKLFLLFIPIILVIRFILYPDISDRFYIAFYLIIIVSLIRNSNLRLRLDN